MPRSPSKPIFVSQDTALPPARPGVRHVTIWPMGIVVADDALRDQVTRVFHWPMILLALAVLPLLGIEFFLDLEKWSGLWWGWFIAMTVIWLAFLIEFAIKVAIAECRMEYCRRNWLDMVIILMPALRPLRVATIARTTRVFTLRGVALKFIRYAATAVIGLEATDRLLQRMGLKGDGTRPEPERMTRIGLIAEVRQLRKLTDEWEAWYAAHEAHIQEQPGHPGGVLPESSALDDDAGLIRENTAAMNEPAPGRVQSAPNAHRSGSTQPDRGRPPRQHPARSAGD